MKNNHFKIGCFKFKHYINFLILITWHILFSCKNQNKTNNREYNLKQNEAGDQNTNFEGEQENDDDIEITELKKSKQEEISNEIDAIASDWEKKYLSNWYSQASFLTPKGRSTSNVLYYLNQAKDSIEKDNAELAKSSLQEIKKIKDKKIKWIDADLTNIIQKIDDYNLTYKHLYECQTRNFIEYLYKKNDNILFYKTDKEKGNNIQRFTNCFTKGVFIFEDNKGEIFKILAGNKPKRCSKYVFLRLTHSSVISKVQKDPNLEIKLYNFEDDKWDNPTSWGGLWFYEVPFEKSIEIECKTYDNDETKKDTIVNKKGVAIIAGFKVTNKITNESKIYTLLKLESYEAVSIEHAYDATQSYIFNAKKKKEEKLEGLKTRKERKKKEIDSSLEDYHISQFMKFEEEKIQETIEDSCDFYDKFVRTGNEFFVPEAIANELISNFNKKEGEM